MALGARASGPTRLLAGWAVLVAVLLLVPIDLIRVVPGLEYVGAPGLDKPGHFLLFLVLGALAAGAARSRTRHPLFLAATVSFLYGALLEALQGLFGFRLLELGDLVADGIGSIAGVWIPVLWRRS